MKNILKNYIYLSLFFALSLTLSSCSEDDTLELDAPKVVPVVTELKGEAVAFEQTTETYSVGPFRGGSEYIWTVTGGEMQPIDGTTGSINVFFSAIGDASISVYEMAANGQSSSPISMNINVFGTPCDWTLETSDTFGDGWNGGYLELTTNGITTTYSEDDDVPNMFVIPISDQAEFSFTYVSGGGTGGGPGWESENYFKLTAPDGTVYEQGSKDYSSIPTPGIVVEGTNDCP